MYETQKKLLRQHGEHFQQMASYVRECDPEELGELEAACAAVTTSNIAWDCYEAAKFLEREIAAVNLQRKRLAEVRGPSLPNGEQR